MHVFISKPKLFIKTHELVRYQYNTGMLNLHWEKNAFLLFQCCFNWVISNLLKGLYSKLIRVLRKEVQDCAMTRLQAGRSLTCLVSCAGLSKAGMPGTAIPHLGSHRVLAAGRTGGRPCYTHHTGSACHPHLGKCSSLVTRPQPH